MANTPAGRPPKGGGSDFDPDTMGMKELRDQPLSVIRTELPALAQALGVSPAELFRSITGQAPAPTTERRIGNVQGAVEANAMATMEGAEAFSCCHSDSW